MDTETGEIIWQVDMIEEFDGRQITMGNGGISTA